MAVQYTAEADAEKYGFERVAELFVAPPEGKPPTSRNALVVGQRGVGKTMLLKFIYGEEKASSTVLPIYVELERWTSRLSVEAVPSIQDIDSPRNIELRACAQLAVSAALMNGVEDALGPKSLGAALAKFPEPLREQFDDRTWQDVIFEQVQRVCGGYELACPAALIPKITEVANDLGEVLRGSGRKLLVLIDQADKVPMLVAEEVARLLDKGGTHVCILATRPYPTAPDPWIIPNYIKAGDDYTLFTLGDAPRTDRWQTFLLSILKRHISERTFAQVEQRIDSLCCLAGGSVRTALLITQRLEYLLINNKNYDSAWESAVMAEAEQEVNLARNAISAFCGAPLKFLNVIRELTYEAMRERGTASLAPTIMKINPDEPGQHGLFSHLTDSAEVFVRAASKAGIIWPTAAQSWIPDYILDEYHVSPLLLLGDSPYLVHQFHKQDISIQVSASDLAHWASHPGAARTRNRRARVFVSYWMSRGAGRARVEKLLADEIGGEVDILVGRAEGSGPWVKAIIDNMRQADVEVIDLTMPRRDVFVELGIAAGLGKPTLLVVEEEAQRQNLPAWLQHLQVLQFGTTDGLREIIKNLRRITGGASKNSEKWTEDLDGNRIELRPDPHLIGCIGTAAFLASSWRDGPHAAIGENDLKSREADASDQDNPDILYDCLKLARESTTLALHFTGETTDYLCCVAGGVLASRRIYKLKNKRQFHRKIIVIKGSGRKGDASLPGIIRRLTGTKIVKPGQLTDTVRARIVEHRNWIKSLADIDANG